jgi:ribosomal protein L37AE/L43A
MEKAIHIGGLEVRVSREDLENERPCVWVGDYNGEDCEKCSRQRVLACDNNKRVCEKCGWSPELGEYVPTDKIF